MFRPSSQDRLLQKTRGSAILVDTLMLASPVEQGRTASAGAASALAVGDVRDRQPCHPQSEAVIPASSLPTVRMPRSQSP